MYMGKQSQTIEAKTKQDIDQTIDALEAHIRGASNEQRGQHTTQSGGGKKKNTRASHTAPRYTDPGYQFRQRMVWATVLILGLGIFGMWGWHMYSVFYDVGRGKIGKETPFTSVDEYFSEAMRITGNGDEEIILPTASSTAEKTPDKQETAVTTLDSLISKLEGTYSTSTVTSTP
jgi:hypothetical protein